MGRNATHRKTGPRFEGVRAKKALGQHFLSDEDIEYYIEAFKPFDKAGAYGIQEWIGFACIKEIKGSVYTVIGLPVQKLYKSLMEF